MMEGGHYGDCPCFQRIGLADLLFPWHLLAPIRRGCFVRIPRLQYCDEACEGSRRLYRLTKLLWSLRIQVLVSASALHHDTVG